MFVVFDNTTDKTNCRLGSSIFMKRNCCKGILLRAIMLTHVLDAWVIPCAYEVTRLVHPWTREYPRVLV